MIELKGEQRQTYHIILKRYILFACTPIPMNVSM